MNSFAVFVFLTSLNSLRVTVRRAAAARGGLDGDVICPSTLESGQTAVCMSGDAGDRTNVDG